MKPYATTKHVRSNGNCRKGKPKKVAHRAARRAAAPGREDESVMHNHTGYVTRMGGVVYQLLKGCVWAERPIKTPLTVGEWLMVPTLFGMVKARVKECDDTSAVAMSGDMICWLSFGADDRGCWTCASTGDAKAITSGLLFL